MIALQWTCGILALLGTFFALFAWHFLLLPVFAMGSLLDGQFPDFWQTSGALCVALLAASGYWIWVSWIAFAGSCRFPYLSTRSFMILCVCHHLGWILTFLVASPQAFNIFGAWLLANLAISLFFIGYAWKEEDMERQRKNMVPRFLKGRRDFGGNPFDEKD